MIRSLLGFLWSLLMLPVKLIMLPFKLLSLLVSIVMYSSVLLLLGAIVFVFIL